MKRMGLAILGFVAIDQATKLMVLWLAFSTLSPALSSFHDGVFLAKISTWFNIILVRNTGVSFSLFSFLPSQIPLISLTLLICFWIFQSLKKENNEWKKRGLILILSGAFGNLIDRIRLEGVIDFIDWHYAGFHWPTFNVADIFITCGATLYLISHIIKRKLP